MPAPGIFTEVIHLYLARDLIVGAPAPDADEELEIQWLPIAKAADMVLRGEWNDGKTALGAVARTISSANVTVRRLLCSAQVDLTESWR